jgi:dihydroxyacetone kinase-like predicted kinase
MRQALDTVVSIEVTMAVRPSNINGVPVAAGAYIGLRDGDLASSGSSPEEVLTSVFNQVGLSPEAVVGIYWGAEAGQPAAEELVRHLEEAHPGMQVDLIYGGQHHYHYLASVE